MSTPVIESIAVNITAAINAITTGNGFNQTLVAVRPRRNDFSDVSPKDGVVLVVQADEEQVDEQAYNSKEWLQPFVIMAIVLDSDDASASIDTRINQVDCDIKKKLREDPQRNSNAINTTILPSVKFDDGEGFTGIAVKCVVNYRTLEDNPYTKA